MPLRRRHEGKLPTSRFRGSNRRLIRVAYFVKSIRENHVSGINCQWPSNVPSSKQSEKVSDEESRRGERRGQGDRRKKKKYAKGRGDNEIAIATRRRRVSDSNSMHKRRVRASVYLLVGREESIMKGRRNISFEIRSRRRLYYYIFE